MKKKLKKLTLRKETLLNLDADLLSQAKGGGFTNYCGGTTLPTNSTCSPDYTKGPSCVPGGCTNEN